MENKKEAEHVWCLESREQPGLIKLRPQDIKKGNYFFVGGKAVAAASSVKTMDLYGKEQEYLTGTDMQRYFLKDLLPAYGYFLWNYKEYSMTPLAFMQIGLLSPDKKLNLLRDFQLWYENTDQETEDFSLEFEVVSRMLLFDDAIIINPKYLRLSEVMRDLMSYMQKEQQDRFLKAREKHVYLFGDAAHYSFNV